MLGSEYALKYSMPHSVVHIVDNSMFTGELPTVIADDPSMYTTLVVTGAPMGPDNEIISINRSDVLNVAFGMNNLSPADIKKYGQTVTYPASLLNQNAPIKFMRVTPEDSTYAFSCLLIQWRWDQNMMHVRFKTTDYQGNSGLPAGVVHSSFKNIDRLNAVLVNRNAIDSAYDEDGTKWKQRTFMTVIAAGRGKNYNSYNYTIDLTNQTRRPANTRYLLSTVDTRVSQVVEQFFASLINENNSLRADAIDSINVAVGKRVKGSSILVPKVNELAVKELYTEYMEHMKEMIDSNIPPSYGIRDMKFVEDVYKTLSINIFEPIFGRYIYNGDNDVRLPYYQVDMVDLDIPKLDTGNLIKTYLDDGDITIEKYIANPTDLQSILDSYTYGIENDLDKYHVGDVFCDAPSSLSLNMITSINQYSGTVTYIPITRLTPDGNVENAELIRAYTTVKKTATDTDADVIAAVNDLIRRGKLVPTSYVKDGQTLYKQDFIVVGLNTLSKSNGLPTFKIIRASYKPSIDPDNPGIVVDDSTSTIYSGKQTIYNIFAFPASTVTSFCKLSDTDNVYRYAPGSTVLDTATGAVYVNKYNSVDATRNPQFTVNSNDPFVVGSVPTKVAANVDMVGAVYDNLVYQKDEATGLEVMWKITGGTADGSAASGYQQGDIVKLGGHSDGEHTCGITYFQLTSVAAGSESGQTITAIRFNDSKYQKNDKVITGNYTTDSTKIYRKFSPAVAPDPWDPTSYFKWDAAKCDFVAGTTEPYSGEGAPDGGWYEHITTGQGTGLVISVDASNISVATNPENADPNKILRFNITGTQGSLFRYQRSLTEIPANYYSDSYGENPSAELGGIAVKNGYAGFLDDDINEIEFKWRYSHLLVQAYRGKMDPRIMSPTRCQAKYLFDGGTNTVVGQTILPYMNYNPIDIINASTIYTDDEKEAILLNNELIANITEFVDVDVKQAMYDLMIFRVYQNIPEDKRPIGPGSGLSLHLDAGVTDANTAQLINQSFNKRFNNPNASWDIGGYVSAADGISYTYIKRLVDNMFAHMRQYTVNKPFTGQYTNILPSEYTGFFPDIDTTDWELRELLYNSGGNAWIMDINGNLQRQSQRTLYRENGTSDLIQESNMRTLSQLCYLLQNKINSYLLEYNDDGVLATLKDEVDNMFSNWVGNTVQDLEIIFKRDINPTDGGEIVVCYVNVTFRGLILRVPIIVNVQRRTTSE